MDPKRRFLKARAADHDFGMSWLRKYGKGRVFYTSFGHNPEIFSNAQMLQHFLAGIQHAFGDLKADDRPSSRPGQVDLMQNRRNFLKSAAAFLPAANDRINVALIGVGWQGGNNVKSILAEPDAQLVAVCDVDAEHLTAAADEVNQKYGNRDCRTYHEFEEVLARHDIDAVVLSVPDHWHGIVSIRAAQAGKDIYGEKPLAQNWAEASAICQAVKRYGTVWQTGSWQRSVAQFRRACELVRNGRIGAVRRIEVGLPGDLTDFDGLGHLDSPVAVPKHLDYDRWLGPAPVAPYCPARVHKTWRWNLNYAAGACMMDWVGHHVDTAHWGAGFDHTGPYEVEGRRRVLQDQPDLECARQVSRHSPLRRRGDHADFGRIRRHSAGREMDRR